MSSKENDSFRESVKELVEEYWTIKDRPDLFEDCVEYVLERIVFETLPFKNFKWTYSVSYLMLEYFQSIAHNAISNTDLNKMAAQDQICNEGV